MVTRALDSEAHRAGMLKYKNEVFSIINAYINHKTQINTCYHIQLRILLIYPGILPGMFAFYDAQTGD